MSDGTSRRDFLAMAGVGALGLSATEGLAQAAPKVRRHNTPKLKPDTSVGPHVLKLDFPELHIGTAVYKEGPTGCTVLHFPKGATAVADIRGGAPATIYTDHLQERSSYIDSICLAGGSSYGLEAATGVAAELFAQRGFSTDWMQIAGVTGAIIFDYRPRDNGIYPDKELGRAALKAAAPGLFPLGARGVGVSAMCGKFLLPECQWELAGQGALSTARAPRASLSSRSSTPSVPSSTARATSCAAFGMPRRADASRCRICASKARRPPRRRATPRSRLWLSSFTGRT